MKKYKIAVAGTGYVGLSIGKVDGHCEKNDNYSCLDMSEWRRRFPCRVRIFR